MRALASGSVDVDSHPQLKIGGGAVFVRGKVFKELLNAEDTYIWCMSRSANGPRHRFAI